MPPQDPIGPADEVELPDKLIESMGKMVRPKLRLDPTIDETILASARLHLQDAVPQRVGDLRRGTKPRRAIYGRSPSQWAAAVVGLAAITLLSIGLRFHLTNAGSNEKLVANDPANTPGSSLQASLPEDLDRNGSVNILDALLLARRVESGEPFDRRWDMNHDGQVDEADVEQIASVAVRLAPTDQKG